MIKIPEMPIGESLTLQKVVTESDTALNYGSGKLEQLFSTPSLVAMMIEASSKLLDVHLPEGYITIGQGHGVVCSVTQDRTGHGQQQVNGVNVGTRAQR